MRRRDLSKVVLGSVAGSTLLAQRTEAQSCTPPCFPLTQVEATVGVTSVDNAYEPVLLPRYSNDWSKAFATSSAGKVKVRVPGGSYQISSEIAHIGDVEIECLGPVMITCTAPGIINSLFRITGKLRIYGAQMTIDGGGRTYLLIHCPTTLPELRNVTFKNSLSVAGLFGANFGGGGINDYSGTNGSGHGWLKNSRGENCGSLVRAAGSGASSDTSFGLIDCTTDAECGSATNVFSTQSMGYGYVRGGLYKGVSTTAPNMTRTARCEYIGGRYEGLRRGPTIGEQSDQVTIVGGLSKDCGFSGVSIDARLGSDGSVPFVVGKVDWTVQGNPNYGVFCQASGVEISIRYMGTGTATSANKVVRLTDAQSVSLGRITAVNSGGAILVELGAGSAPAPGSSAFKTGHWQSDGTSTSPIRCTTNASAVYMSNIRTVNSNFDVSFLDDTILVDASAGAIDLDMPDDDSARNVVGKVWRIKVVNGANNITITRQNGGSTAINGGPSYTIAAGANYREVVVESVGDGSYVVTSSV